MKDYHLTAHPKPGPDAGFLHRYLARRGFAVERVSVGAQAGTAIVTADKNPASAWSALDPDRTTRRHEVADAIERATSLPELKRVLAQDILPRLTYDDEGV